MNDTILLDTSAYSAAPRMGGLRQAIEEANSVFLNVITLGELLSGFHGGTQFERNAEELHDFIMRTGTKILPIDIETAERYAYIRHYLKKEGTPVGPNDLWIAATAMQHGLKVLTTDRDFQKIPQILIQLF